MTSTPMRRRALAGGLALAATGLRQTTAQTENWPSRPVRIIIPSAAGGAADFVGRTVGHAFEPHLRQPVIVDNRPGAGGITGTDATRLAAPDGHTFMISTSSTHAANEFLYRRLPYDPVRDFAHVGRIGTSAAIAMVPSTAPYKSIPALIDFAKANPGRVFFGYYSSSSQVPAALLKARADLDITGAAYRNITGITPDLMTGQIQFAFMDSLSAAAALQSGRLTPIAVTAQHRVAQLPDLPTVAETLPGFVVEIWLGLSAPAGTPAPIIARMSDLLRGVLADPAVAEALTKQGLTVGFMPTEAMGPFIAADRERWREWVRIAGIEPE